MRFQTHNGVLMADIFEQTLKQLNEITDSASQKVGSFFKTDLATLRASDKIF